jgi:hypothetical protein
MQNSITLNEAEQRLARYLAEAREAHNHQVGARDVLCADAERVQNKVEAFGAEIAYCKIVNCYPNLVTDCFEAFDVRLADGRRVDVKQTIYPQGRLIVKLLHRAAPDLYALMVGAFPTYRLAGHIAAADMLQEANIDPRLPRPAYAVAQARLTVQP